MTSSIRSGANRTFSLWLITGLLLYIAGFYLAPYSKTQYQTLYVGLILPGLYFSLWHFREHYLSENRALLWVFFTIIVLYLPSLWADDGNLPDTLRKNLKGVLSVTALAIAIRHLYLRYPSLPERLPTLIIAVSAVALLLFYWVLMQSGLGESGNLGMGTLGDNPNETGLAFSVSLLCVFVIWLKKPTALWWLLPAAVLAIAIWLAYSRSALVGLAVTLPFIVLDRYTRMRVSLGYLVLCLAGGLAAAFLIFNGQLDGNELLSKRPDLWRDFLAHFPRFHWLWGAGLSESVTIYSEHLSQKLEPHSLFFALFLRGGLLALTVFVTLACMALYKAFRSQRDLPRLWGYLLLFGLITQLAEGVYPVRTPNSFWLYTWLPLLLLLLSPDASQQTASTDDRL